MRRVHFLCYFLVCSFVLAGCSGHPAAGSAGSPPKTPLPAPKVRVSNRPGNVHGGVFIVEYHKIAKKEARWDRSIILFRKDLERLYDLGFRPVTLRSYLDGELDLPPGASPVVVTFDDSHLSQFNLRPDGTLDPDCALGIWRAFAKSHRDFPIRATFFVLPNTGPWGQPKLADWKLKMLRDWGCEVGSHTLSHPKLSKLDEGRVLAELKGASDYVKSKGFDPFAIALPFGISPKSPGLLKRFHRAALLVGAGPAPAPGSSKFEPMRLPRIQGIDEPYGITYWLDKVQNGTCSVYVEP